MVKEYSLETQKRAASELESLQPGSVLGLFMLDYKILRNEVRACRSH